MNGESPEVPNTPIQPPKSDQSLREAPPLQTSPSTEPTQPTETNSPESGPKIDPQILENLGLTQDDVENYNEQQLKKEREISAMKQKGAEYYLGVRELHGSSLRTPAVNFGNFTIPIESKVLKSIPDAVASGAEKGIRIIPEQKGQVEAKMKAFCQGFGEEALQNQDYISAINALDISTEGGILQNEQGINQLRQVAQSDKTTGIKIAEAIQERLDLRKAAQPTENSQAAPPPPEQPQ